MDSSNILDKDKLIRCIKLHFSKEQLGEIIAEAFSASLTSNEVEIVFLHGFSPVKKFTITYEEYLAA